jgi:hypothetical protein
MTHQGRNDMHEIKQIIRRNPDWLRRRAHRAMLLAMVRRMNAERKGRAAV